MIWSDMASVQISAPAHHLTCRVRKLPGTCKCPVVFPGIPIYDATQPGQIYTRLIFHIHIVFVFSFNYVTHKKKDILGTQDVK
jgi:hypothetical protein